MKRSITIVATFGVTNVDAAGCGVGDYQEFMTSFAQGLQFNTATLNNDCSLGTNQFAGKLKNLFASVKNFSTNNWLAPVYLFQESLVESTTMFSNCQATNAAKQLTTRLTTWGGLFNFIAVFPTAYLKDRISPGKSELWTSLRAVWNPTNCQSLALNLGSVYKFALAY